MWECANVWVDFLVDWVDFWVDTVDFGVDEVDKYGVLYVINLINPKINRINFYQPHQPQNQPYQLLSTSSTPNQPYQLLSTSSTPKSTVSTFINLINPKSTVSTFINLINPKINRINFYQPHQPKKSTEKVSPRKGRWATFSRFWLCWCWFLPWAAAVARPRTPIRPGGAA
jgi:hypothetical protein